MAKGMSVVTPPGRAFEVDIGSGHVADVVDADQLVDAGALLCVDRETRNLCTFPIELESRVWQKGCQ